MQSNQLGATQLLSSFLAETNGQIAHKMKLSQFSRELATQHKSFLQNGSKQTAHLARSNSTKSSTTEAVTTAPTAPSATQHTQSTDHPKASKDKKHSSDSQTPEQIERQMVFTDPLLLKSIINELHLPASTRDACLAAEDDQGRISLKALYDILNQSHPKTDPSQTSPNNPGQVSSQAVQQLMASLSQLSAKSAHLSLNVQVKPKGTYNLKEFRQLLQSVVSQIQDKDSKPHVDSTPQASLAADSENGTAASEDSQPAVNFEKIPHITSDFIPTPLADAVNHHTSPEQTQSPPPSSSSKQSAAAGNPPPQSVTKPQADRVSIKSVEPALVNPTSSRTESKTTQAQVTQSTKTPSPAPSNAAGSNGTHTTQADAPAPPPKQPIATSSQSPAAQQPDGASLAQLSSQDGTVLVRLQKASASDKIGGEQQHSEASANSTANLSGTNPGAGQTKLDQSSSDSFGQQGEPKRDGNFSSATPANKATGVPIGGFSQVSQNELQQLGSFASAGHPAPENPTLSLQDPSWPDKLSQQLQEAHNQGQMQLTLELNPKDLGHLTLHIETQQNQVHAFISADNEQAKNLLMQNAAALRTSLQEHGLMLGQMFVDVRRENGGGQSAQQQRSRSKKVSKHSGIAKADSRVTTSAQALYQTRQANQLINLVT